MTLLPPAQVCCDRDLFGAAQLLITLLQISAPEVWISPGNRSQPLVRAAFALADRGLCRIHTHFDERGLAFAALGCARVRRQPVVLICTSGSAVANWLPAFCEAAAQGVPLIGLSADRPPEEHGIGAHQTWPHLPMLAAGSVACRSLPPPDDPLYPHAVEQMLQIVESLDGPLHLNCPYREPFGLQLDLDMVEPLGLVEKVRPPHDVPCALLLERLQSAQRPLITLGARWDPIAQSLLDWAQPQGILVLADICSQHGCAERGALRLRDGWSAVFTQPALAPDLWVHVGGPLLSKPFLQAMQQARPALMVVQDGTRPWDPARLNGQRIPVTEEGLAQTLLKVAAGGALVHQRQTWLQACQSAYPVQPEPMSQEAQVVVQAFMQTPADALLLVGNSMPIRHLLQWAPNRPGAPKIWANRGLSGIDGNLATCLGMAAAYPGPVNAIVGDLTALHDLNSLALGHRAQGSVRLCIVNNFGGGIFQRVAKEVPERVRVQGLITPHLFRFAGAAQQFGWTYASASAWPSSCEKLLLWEPPLTPCWPQSTPFL